VFFSILIRVGVAPFRVMTVKVANVDRRMFEGWEYVVVPVCTWGFVDIISILKPPTWMMS